MGREQVQQNVGDVPYHETEDDDGVKTFAVIQPMGLVQDEDEEKNRKQAMGQGAVLDGPCQKAGNKGEEASEEGAGCVDIGQQGADSGGDAKKGNHKQTGSGSYPVIKGSDKVGMGQNPGTESGALVGHGFHVESPPLYCTLNLGENQEWMFVSCFSGR